MIPFFKHKGTLAALDEVKKKLLIYLGFPKVLLKI